MWHFYDLLDVCTMHSVFLLFHQHRDYSIRKFCSISEEDIFPWETGHFHVVTPLYRNAAALTVCYNIVRHCHSTVTQYNAWILCHCNVAVLILCLNLNDVDVFVRALCHNNQITACYIVKHGCDSATLSLFVPVGCEVCDAEIRVRR